MSSIADIRWTIKEFTEVILERRNNKFDSIVFVSGDRGNGKSTLIHKSMIRFKPHGFTHNKNQVYTREDIIKLLKAKRSFCWDDEAINSGYKRDFQNKGQQEMIKILTNYRSNENIYFSAAPKLYTMDKDLRDLVTMHVHIIEKGIAVLFLPQESSIFSTDKWDAKHNIKVEQEENNRISDNPNSSFRYHKFSTFAGYLYFQDVTEKQRNVYEFYKELRRAKEFDNAEARKTDITLELVYREILEGKVTKEDLKSRCLEMGKKFSSVVYFLNRRMQDEGKEGTLLKRLAQTKDKNKKSVNEINNISGNEAVKNLVPKV